MLSLVCSHVLLDARKHCEFHNICFPDGIPRTLPDATLPFTLPFTLPGILPHKEAKKAPAPKKPTQADLDTAIKVLQLTDIHIEQMYAEVGL